MKFLDLVNNVNEEVSNELYAIIIERLEKRALLIYKALSEGHVVVDCFDDSGLNSKPLKLRYVLPENPRINFEDRYNDQDKIVDYGVLMSAGSVKMYFTPNPQEPNCDIDWYDAVQPIRKKFRALDVQIVFDGIELIEEKPLNEGVEESEKLRLERETEKLRLEKRIKKIFNVLKSGAIEVVDNSGIYFEKSIKCEYKITSDPIIRVNGVFAKREDGYDRLDDNGNPILLRYKQTIQIYDVVVNHKLSKSSPAENHIFRELVKENIKNKFKQFDINCYVKDVYFSNENGEFLYEDALKKPEKQDISPEERERIERKVNVVMKAITKLPFTVLDHRVKIKIPDYRLVVHPPNVIKYTDEYDQPVYQVTEPDVRVHVDEAFVYTDSEEIYNYLTNEVKRDHLIYNVYHEIRNRIQKFNMSFTIFDVNVRFEDNNNDLQEQDDNPDDDDEYNYIDSGTPSQEKKIRVIYKALKEGYVKIKFDGEIYKYKYVLPNKFGVKYSKVSDAMTLQVPKFGFKLYDTKNVLMNPYGDPVTKQMYLTAYRLISKRFQINFGIIFEEPHYNYDNYQNLYGDLQEAFKDTEITDKERKKAKAIFTAYKTGVLNFDNDLPNIRYHLTDDYWIKKGSKGTLTIVLRGNSFENIKMNKIDDDGNETYMKPNSHMWNACLWATGRKIEKLFNQYDIEIKLY